VKLLLILLASVSLAAAAHPNPERLADAIYKAEGGSKARSPYGVLSVKVKDAAHARRITLTSIRNNWTRWERAGRPGEFIDFMADRWCPKAADPAGNVNWKKNVKFLYRKQNKK
jgi:hypothetical protein